MKYITVFKRYAIIISKLRLARPLTARELVDAINNSPQISGEGQVGIRTVQRDIADLRDGLGLNIVDKPNNTYTIEPMKNFCNAHYNNMLGIIYEILKGFTDPKPEELVLNAAINQSKDVKLSLLTEDNKNIDIEKAVTLRAEIRTTLSSGLIESLSKCKGLITVDKPVWLKEQLSK